MVIGYLFIYLFLTAGAETEPDVVVDEAEEVREELEGALVVVVVGTFEGIDEDVAEGTFEVEEEDEPEEEADVVIPAIKLVGGKSCCEPSDLGIK